MLTSTPLFNKTSVTPTQPCLQVTWSTESPYINTCKNEEWTCEDNYEKVVEIRYYRYWMEDGQLCGGDLRKSIHGGVEAEQVARHSEVIQLPDIHNIRLGQTIPQKAAPYLHSPPPQPLPSFKYRSTIRIMKENQILRLALFLFLCI